MEQELQLVRRAQSGDTGAFAQLYEGVYQDLYRFALYVLKHPQDAQDVVRCICTNRGASEIRSVPGVDIPHFK